MITFVLISRDQILNLLCIYYIPYSFVFYCFYVSKNLLILIISIKRTMLCVKTIIKTT